MYVVDLGSWLCIQEIDWGAAGSGMGSGGARECRSTERLANRLLEVAYNDTPMRLFGKGSPLSPMRKGRSWLTCSN